MCMNTWFCHLTVVWRPLADEHLAISTQSIHRWKVHLVGYNSVADYGSAFIRLAVIASETREMSRNSKRIWPYCSSRSSKVIDLVDLGVNGKPLCDFLLGINCNFTRLLPFSRYSGLKIENCWFYPTLPCLTPPLGGNSLEFLNETCSWKN